MKWRLTSTSRTESQLFFYMFQKMQTDGYLKIWHLGILNSLSWRNLRKQQSGKVTSTFSPPFSPETGHKTLMQNVCSVYLKKKRASFFPEDKEMPKRFQTNGPCKIFPSLLHLPCTPLSIIFLHDCPLFIKVSIKILRFNYFFESSFSYEGSWVM